MEDHALGFYQALVEARLPFDMVHDLPLDAEHPGPYGTLILPTIAALSDAQCRQLSRFAERGGNVIAVRQQGRTLLHPVNLSGHSQTGYFPPISMTNIAGRLEGNFTRARAIRAGKAIPLTRVESTTEFTVPQSVRL